MISEEEILRRKARTGTCYIYKRRTKKYAEGFAELARELGAKKAYIV